MPGRSPTSQLLAALTLAAVAAGCAGAGDDVVVATTGVVLDTEPTTTITIAADQSDSTTAETAGGTEPSGPETSEEPPPATVDGFIESWSAVAAGFPEVPGLAPTISGADVAPDPTIGVGVFVEQVTPQTMIGGIVDPETGTITGLMGLSEPGSDDALAMVEIIWVGAFGIDDRARMAELFPADAVDALPIGEQITRVHRGRSVVMNHVDGADPDDGLFVFTVGEEELLADDPSHDSITNVVLGLLVRTS